MGSRAPTVKSSFPLPPSISLYLCSNLLGALNPIGLFLAIGRARPPPTETQRQSSPGSDFNNPSTSRVGRAERAGRQEQLHQSSHHFRVSASTSGCADCVGACCCCCLVPSVVSDSVRPHKRQPTRLPRPWDSPGKNTGAGCHFLLQCMKVKSESKVAQSCPTLSDLMDCSLPGSSVHGVCQARVLEWVAIAFSCRCLWLITNTQGEG